MPNHIAWASSGKRDIGERGVHSHPYLCQEWRLRETHAEMPHKQELLEVYEISLTDVFGGKIQFAATTTDSKNIRLTKQRCYRNGGEGGIRTHGTVSRTLAFEASAFNRSATSPRSLQTQS